MSSSKDYFDWHYDISTLFLMIPPNRWYLKVPYWAITVPHLILICLVPFLEMTKFCLGGSGNFSTDVLNLGISVLHFMGVNRVARWLFIKKNVEEDLLKGIRNINLEYALFNDPRESAQNIISRRNPIEDYRILKMHQTTIICLRLFIAFLTYVGLNLSISYTLNYFQMPTYEQWNPVLNKTSTYRDYPYPLWYPFDVSISDGYYYLGFFYQPYAFFFLMCGFFCVDSLVINAVIHLRSHVNIVGYAFTYVDKNVHPLLNQEATMRLKEKRIIKCIKELQKIYKCARTIDNIFSPQVLIQMICLAIIMCCSVYRVTTVLGAEVGWLSTMVAACVTEAFVITWFHQSFTLEVFELLHRIYELDWINYPPKTRKMLWFLIQRLQKPFYFTMGYWQTIDVGVFLATIKASYSFYTLITSSSTLARRPYLDTN